MGDCGTVSLNTGKRGFSSMRMIIVFQDYAFN